MIFGMFLAAALVVLFLGAKAFSGPNAKKATKRRLQMVKERHGEGGALAAHAQAQIRKLMSKRQSRADGIASTLIPRPALLRQRLERTGKDISLAKYGMIMAGVGIAMFVVLLFKGAPFMLALFMSLAAGFGLPHFFVSRMIKKRTDKFTTTFPDAIELMVRGLRSGLPITETLGIVASELPGPLGSEFRAINDKMKIGRTMEVALQETADRLNTPEIQFFVITLAIQRETGGNLAETLSNLAEVLRKRSQMKLKIKAMSSEAKASAYIIGALPFVVFALIWSVNAVYLSGFFTDDRLIIAGLGGGLWMGIGVMIMAKMISFEI